MQGNFQLLEEIGYVTLQTKSYIGGGVWRLSMSASLTPKGYVLLHEPAD